jgi:uncharacterized protein (DUF427 family)
MKGKPVAPGPGQESVWDYPRPPRAEPVSKHIQVLVGDTAIADTRNAIRVLETSHPPVYYLPPEDVRMELVREAAGSSFCEWKGAATYYTIVAEARRVERAAWAYPSPTPQFAGIKGYLAFYPQLMDACFVDGERARPQPGGFYGGWVTKDIVGPFKGEPGTEFW